MDLFNKKFTIIYIEDRICYLTAFDNAEETEAMHHFDIPLHVVEDGKILDASQLHYLLRKQLIEADLLKSNCLFVVNTADAVNRAMHVPTMTQKEIGSLIENESSNLFVQDLEEYRLEYVDLDDDEEIHHLLLTICSKSLLEDYFELAQNLEIRMEGVIPFSSLLIQYVHRLGGGRVGLMSSGHTGFYYANENRYYGRSERNDALLELMARYPLEFSHLSRIYEGQYDERLVEIDRESFRRELDAAFYEGLEHVENMGSDFALEDRKLITGSIAESGLYELITSDRAYKILPLYEIFSVAYEYRDDVRLFQKEERKRDRGSRNILPMIAVIAAFLILIGTFAYGEKLKQENRRLILESAKRQEALNDQTMDSSREEEMSEEDIAGMIGKIKDSIPDTISVTSIDYEGDTLQISGEGSEEDTIEAWRSELETAIEKKVEQNPSATIGNIIYFQFSIALNSNAAGQMPSEEGVISESPEDSLIQGGESL